MVDKIVRHTGEYPIFAENNTATADRVVFGKTAQSNTINENTNTPEYRKGWIVNTKPPRGWMNGAMFALSKSIAYNFQMGIPEFDSTQTYFKGSVFTIKSGKSTGLHIVNLDNTTGLTDQNLLGGKTLRLTQFLGEKDTIQDAKFFGQGDLTYDKDTSEISMVIADTLGLSDTYANLVQSNKVSPVMFYNYYKSSIKYNLSQIVIDFANNRYYISKVTDNAAPLTDASGWEEFVFHSQLANFNAEIVNVKRVTDSLTRRVVNHILTVWGAGIAYEVGDCVIQFAGFANNDFLAVICLVDHVSNNNNKPSLSQTYWGNLNIR